MRASVIIAQSCARRVLAVKHVAKVRADHEKVLACRAAYLETFVKMTQLSLACIRIQRQYRAYRSQQLNKARMNAILTIQRYTRGWLGRREVERKQNAIITIQRSVKTYLARVYARKECAAVVIQRCTRQWLSRLDDIKRTRSALTIQAYFRGYIVRKRACKKMRQMRNRIRIANANADVKMTLGYRTTSALSVLLTHKQLSFVLRACENLEVATALSTRCSERLVENSAVPIIFQLIRSCNRSKPHTAVLIKALSIISNLAAHAGTMNSVFSQQDSTGLMVELIQMYVVHLQIMHFCKCIFKIAVTCVPVFILILILPHFPPFSLLHLC